MIVPMKSSILRKIGIGALILLILVMLGLIITVAVQNHRLEKAKQGLVESKKQEIQDLKDDHRSEISDLKLRQVEQDTMLARERRRNKSLELELTQLEKQIPISDERIDHMDSTALLAELRSIRATHQIY